MKIPKDPLYEVSDHDRAWLIALWPIALATAATVGILMAHEAEAPAPAESPPAESPPPPAAPDIRTEVLTGRMICEKTGEHGCVEWRLYRTVEH
jgi:hypothetical protein